MSFWGPLKKKPEKDRSHHKNRELPQNTEWSEWDWDDDQKQEYRSRRVDGEWKYQIRIPSANRDDNRTGGSDASERPVGQVFRQGTNTAANDGFSGNAYKVSASPPTPGGSTAYFNSAPYPTTITSLNSPRSVGLNQPLIGLPRTTPNYGVMGYPGQGYPGQGRMGRDFAVDSAGHPLSTVPLSATSPAGGPGFRVDNKREENRQDDESESSVSTSRESYPDEAPADLPKSPFTNTITYSRAPPGGGQPQFYAGVPYPMQSAPIASMSEPRRHSLAQGSSTVASTDGQDVHIGPDNPALPAESDPRFKVHHGRDFKFGRVFKIEWTEPKGDNSKDPGPEYEKTRPFLIIRPSDGHCTCLPILTYGGRATTKRGVKSHHHTIIYTKQKNKDRPRELPGEDKLHKKAIRIIPITPREQLDPRSRLNYHKIYTVEWNVKVYFIGTIDQKHIDYLKRDYNLAHQPLPESPNFQYTHEDSEPNDDRGNDGSSMTRQRDGNTRKNSLSQNRFQKDNQSQQRAAPVNRRDSLSNSERPQGRGGLQSRQNPRQSSERTIRLPQRGPREKSIGRDSQEPYEPSRDAARLQGASRGGDMRPVTNRRRDSLVAEPREFRQQQLPRQSLDRFAGLPGERSRSRGAESQIDEQRRREASRPRRPSEGGEGRSDSRRRRGSRS